MNMLQMYRRSDRHKGSLTGENERLCTHAMLLFWSLDTSTQFQVTFCQGMRRIQVASNAGGMLWANDEKHETVKR